MGVFDYVNVPPVKCPECGELLEGFQTRDTECVLTEVELGDVNNFYTLCDGCKSFVEFNRKKPRKSTLDDFEMTIDGVSRIMEVD